jgi:hypothetical protein
MGENKVVKKSICGRIRFFCGFFLKKKKKKKKKKR